MTVIAKLQFSNYAQIFVAAGEIHSYAGDPILFIDHISYLTTHYTLHYTVHITHTKTQDKNITQDLSV